MENLLAEKHCVLWPLISKTYVSSFLEEHCTLLGKGYVKHFRAGNHLINLLIETQEPHQISQKKSHSTENMTPHFVFVFK